DLDRFAPDPKAYAAVRTELGLAPGATLVGVVGRHHPLKDHATFLRAAALLAGERGRVHFVLAGRGLEPGNPALEPLVGDTALRGRVHLLGERDDMPRLLAALDVLALSSVSESFPNVVGEAMACGVPCVVTDVGDAARIVGPTGIVVQPGNPAALADGLRRV